MARTPKRTIKVVDAAFSPAGLVICPNCFSRPSSQGQRDHILAGKRGWSVSMDADLVRMDRQDYVAVVASYPCSSEHCLTVIRVRSLLAFLGTTKAHAPFITKSGLKGKRAEQFLRGVISKDGIWREAGVAIAQPPEIPVPKVVKVTKNVKATTPKRRKPKAMRRTKQPL